MNSALRSRLHRFKTWVGQHRTRVIIGVGVFLIVVAGGTAFALLSQKPTQTPPAPVAARPKPEPTVYYSPLTGLKVDDKKDLTKPVTAIMIENSPEARPQSGLKAAEVVYEAIAEGGITRFLAVYQQNKPTLIGPVRSVRPYYLDWVVPYDASIAHVGGSAKALKEIRNGSYRDIDQFFNATTYWRSTDRYAPHNVYTSFKKIDALNKAKKYTTSHPKEMLRIDGKASKKPTAKSVTVTISGPLFNSTYRYDIKHNRYIRSQAGAQHKDREKGVITPTVVVVLKVSEHEEFEDTWRGVIKTTGSGKATIFQNGIAAKATWHKSARSNQLSFTGSDGKAIALVRGQTWITALPSGNGSVSWK